MNLKFSANLIASKPTTTPNRRVRRTRQKQARRIFAFLTLTQVATDRSDAAIESIRQLPQERPPGEFGIPGSPSVKFEPHSASEAYAQRELTISDKMSLTFPPVDPIMYFSHLQFAGGVDVERGVRRDRGAWPVT